MTTTVRRNGVPRAPVARIFGPAARAINPLIAGLAGSRAIPLWAVVRHRGRRSGRMFNTPVAVGHRDGALFIPLPFGTGTDWARNVIAAGGCTIRWKGAEYAMTDPVVLDQEAALPAFNAIEARLLRALGIQGILRVRFAPSE